MKGLAIFFLKKGFAKGKIDTTLFTKYVKNDILIIQIYIDDIFFCSANESLCKKFEQYMKDEFE